jgi:hypothetical protein
LIFNWEKDFENIFRVISLAILLKNKFKRLREAVENVEICWVLFPSYREKCNPNKTDRVANGWEDPV